MFEPFNSRQPAATGHGDLIGGLASIRPAAAGGPSPGLPRRRQLLAAALAGTLLPLRQAWAQGPAKAGAAAPRGREAMTITFRGAELVHRWSKNGQHEFTPAGDADLATWRDMLTLNVHESATSGEQLAVVANQVLANYRQHGKVLQTRSIPRSPARPAEHLIVAVLGNPQLLEAAFARCLLHDGVALVAVVSHRVHGKTAGPEMSAWLGAQGAQVDQALMAWTALPALARLKQLPTSA